MWDFLAPVLEDGARVAIVGAGNGDDLPLRRIAHRAGAVTLIDIDPRAANDARRRLGRAGRRKVEVIGHDLTRGGADAIVHAALGDGRRSGVAETISLAAKDGWGAAEGANPPHLTGYSGGEGQPLSPPLRDPLPGAPYGLVVGDLFYSQLLYPALVDLGVDVERRKAALDAHGASLTRAAVARLHASAPRVIHVHDPLAWWDGHEQPVGLVDVLAVAADDGPAAALALVARGNGPHESDPRAALADLGIRPAATALWRWPFSSGVDYLACATLA